MSFISLNCKVGRVSPPPPITPICAVVRKYRSPYYYRRQERRKASRCKPESAEKADKEIDTGKNESCSEVDEEVDDDVIESEKFKNT